MIEKTYQITRAGCLAVHLMPEYHGRKLQNAVSRIAAHGPKNEFERRAVRMANGEIAEGPKFRVNDGE